MKAKKKNRFNQYILFSSSPSQDPANHSAAQKSGAGSLLINCPKCWNLYDCTTTKILQKPGKLCFLFPAQYCLCIFYRQPIHCPLSCHTRVYTHTKNGTHRENLLNFTNKLQKGSGNMVTLFRITQNFAWCNSSLHLIENLIFQDKSEAYSLMGFDGLVGFFSSYFL